MDPRANHISSVTIIFHSKKYSTSYVRRERQIKKYLKKGYKLGECFCTGNDAIGYTTTLSFSL